MKNPVCAITCLAILLLSLQSHGQTPAVLENNNVFTGTNAIMQTPLYSGTNSPINDTFNVFLNGYTEPSGSGGGMTNGISVGGITPSTATVVNVTGVATRMTSNCNSSGRTVCNTVGGYFVGNANADGAGVWGINPIVQDFSGISNANLLGGEFDLGVAGAPQYVRGIAILLGGTGTMPTGSIGLEIGGSVRGNQGFNRGIQVDDGSASLHAIQIGATLPSGMNLPSQSLAFARFDSGSLRRTDVSLRASSPGDLVLTAASGRSIVFTNGAMIGSGSSSNSDLNGQLTFSNSTTSSTYLFGGTYTSPPICTIAPLADPVGRLYIRTLTTHTLQLADTTSVSISVDYQCSKRD
jgi:hypothetical protein